jgi:hypothetical protein
MGRHSAAQVNGGRHRTFVVRVVILIPSDADCDDRHDDWIFERKK